MLPYTFKIKEKLPHAINNALNLQKFLNDSLRKSCLNKLTVSV